MNSHIIRWPVAAIILLCCHVSLHMSNLGSKTRTFSENNVWKNQLRYSTVDTDSELIYLNHLASRTETEELHLLTLAKA